MGAYIRTYVKYAAPKLEAYSDLTGYSHLKVKKLFNDASFQSIKLLIVLLPLIKRYA